MADRILSHHHHHHHHPLLLLTTGLFAGALLTLAVQKLWSKPLKEDIRSGIEECIGNTPLIRIKSLSDATGCEILGKAEVCGFWSRWLELQIELILWWMYVGRGSFSSQEGRLKTGWH